jgi:hypothetical protein
MTDTEAALDCAKDNAIYALRGIIGALEVLEDGKSAYSEDFRRRTRCDLLLAGRMLADHIIEHI